MPLTLLEPPDLAADFWAQPELVAAVEREQLGQFLIAFRGAQRPRWSQDQVARWLGCSQARISEMENDVVRVGEVRLDAIFRALQVPSSVVTRWGSNVRIR
jgi:hypothetical protein